MSKSNKMDAERNPFKFIMVFIIRYFIVLTVVFYLVRFGITALVGLKTGEFNFDFRNVFLKSIKDGLFWGVVFGIGEWAMRKAKAIDKGKK
ncbi:hypothetical protein [Superficieibacter sp. 1612_C1]|uniref:hypothetical protein n=1 Tax=Superficieibacter sp. 1612_C1 TaxID=2780382 RepID=UPI001883F5C2|nr:hypothetical protein [Superficieibacter sp. 1612_C1]